MTDQGLTPSKDDQLLPASNGDDGSKKRSILASIAEVVRASWNPVAILKPRIDPELSALPIFERITEVCRYKLQQLEYSLSSRGGLREWTRLTVVLTLVLAIPAVLVVPLITFFLGAFVTWTAFIFQAALNLLYVLFAVIAFVVTALVFEYCLKKYLESRKVGNQKKGRGR